MDTMQPAGLEEDRLIEMFNKNGHDIYQGRHHLAASAIFRRCMMLRPGNPTYHTNYGSTLWHLGRYEEAEVVLREAVARWFDYDAALENYGKTLVTLERYTEAEAMFNTIINRRPESETHRVHLQRAFCRFDDGNWRSGFEDFEHRRKVTDHYPTMPMPEWQGEDLNGKTLYVQAEQGAGDVILLSRYLWRIKQKWPTCKIKFCCNHLLAKVLWEYSIRGVVDFMPEGIPWKAMAADYGIYLASIPRLFGCRPDNIPVDPGFIAERCRDHDFALPPSVVGTPLKVGICWTGNPQQNDNIRRSTPVEYFMQLSGDPRWLLYSLQVKDGVDQFYALNGHEIICDLSKEVGPPHGFVATGAAMAKLDLVITVCTVTAHLAGAMGVPTLLLLSKEPYWVWGRYGSTTPWYPSIRIFRQEEFGDWDPVFEEVRQHLVKLYETS